MALKTFFLFVTIGLLGCTTLYDVKHTKPRISYTTSRPPNLVMKCIRDKWMAHHPTIYEEKTGDGWIIRQNDVLPNATVALVTISGSEPNVEVKYFNRTNRLKLHRLEEEILACKDSD
jgi:hypothetical protein